MIGFLMQTMGQVFVAGIMLRLVDDLGRGALEGLAAGAAVGAIVWCMNRAPDTMGRVLLFGIMATLLMALFWLLRILGTLPGVSMLTLMDAFQSGSAQTQMIIDAGRWIGIAGLGGALVAVLFSVPGEAIKGAIIGLFVGALLGAVLSVVLKELGVALNPIFFQLIVGLLTWAVFTSLAAG